MQIVADILTVQHGNIVNFLVAYKNHTQDLLKFKSMPNEIFNCATSSGMNWTFHDTAPKWTKI